MADDVQLHNLIRTVAHLMPKTSNGWVRCRWVAKELHGSAEFEFMVSAMARTYAEEGLFVVSNNDKVIKLTEQGLQRAAQLTDEKKKRTQLIADAVRKYAGRLRPLRYDVVDVSTVTRTGSRIVQALHVTLEDHVIPSEAPVKFWPQDGSVPTRGKIVGQDAEGGVIYVAFDSQVYRVSLPAELTIDRGFLLQQLANSLETLEEFPPLVDALWSQQSSNAIVADPSSARVAEQLGTLALPWTRFLWGPPGGGKTFALTRFVQQLLVSEPNTRILLVAPSNLAVDVALEQLLEHCESSGLNRLVEERKLLRFGYPRKQQIVERQELLGPADLDVYSSQVTKLSRQISRAEREGAPDEEIAALRAEFLEAQEQLKNRVYEHVKQSRVVATTTTLAYLGSSPISKLQWNTVLVDEVTMVPPAMCVFLGSLATDRFLLAGDPRQLGPVYERSSRSSADDFRWMGRDVFEATEVTEGTGKGRAIAENDSRLVRITAQRRCTADIWQKVRHLYPRVQSRVNEAALQKLRQLPPGTGKGVVLLDTGKCGSLATCERIQGSWQNEFTAELALEVASVLSAEAEPDNPSIAIIAPYRAQIRQLRRWIKQENSRPSSAYQSVEVGTVHQFQGSQADIVIFDVVDGVGRSGLGALLRGDTGIRLVTVAATRARAKLIILADRYWYERSSEPGDNHILWDLIVGRRDAERLMVAPPPSSDKGAERHQQLESPIEVALFEAMQEVSQLQDVAVQHRIYDDSGKIVSRADLAFPDLKFAIYCDGARWHLRRDQWQRDIRSRNRLVGLGWTFNVFSGAQIQNEPEVCIDQILETYRNRTEELEPV